MALTQKQQQEVDNLRALVVAKELEVRTNYPATFAANGSLFFDLFAELKEQIKKIEQA